MTASEGEKQPENYFLQINAKSLNPPYKGDYFATHGVLEGLVTRRRLLEVTPKGYDGKTERVEVEELTVPIPIKGSEKTKTVVVRALRYDFPEETRSPEKPQSYSLVFVPGGSGDAVGNADWIAKFIDQIDLIRDSLPFNIDNIIILPHVAGSPRDKGIDDPAKQETMTMSAKVHQQILENPELKVAPDGIIGVGYSYGGDQITEDAALLGDRIKYLMLLDPAGMANHADLEWQFSAGSTIATLKKYFIKYWQDDKNIFHFLPKGLIQALKEAGREIRIAWGSEYAKLPNATDMVKDLTGKNVEAEKLARAYGLEDQYAGTAPYSLPAKTDSTKKAREYITATIVFSPVEGAKVVNVIVSRLRKIYPTAESVLKAGSDPVESLKLEHNVKRMLKEMFPGVDEESLYYAGFPDITHSAVRAEDAYLDRVLSVFKEAAQTEAKKMAEQPLPQPVLA